MRRYIKAEADVVAAGALVHTVDKLGRTPLWYAAKKGDATTVHALLRAEVEVNIPDKVGRCEFQPVFKAPDGGCSARN